MEDPDFLWETGDQSEMDTTGESEDSYDMTAPHCAARSFGPPHHQSLIGAKGNKQERGEMYQCSLFLRGKNETTGGTGFSLLVFYEGDAIADAINGKGSILWGPPTLMGCGPTVTWEFNKLKTLITSALVGIEPTFESTAMGFSSQPSIQVDQWSISASILDVSGLRPQIHSGSLCR
jgi:hypothetical protein